MRYGVCADWKRAPELKQLGYDYIESGLSGLSCLQPAQLEQAEMLLHANGLSMEAANRFLPSELRLCGEEADPPAVREYALRTLELGARLGLKVAVLGSGGARRCPEGYPPKKAREQLLYSLEVIGEAARQYQVTIAVEPLNREECNQLNTLAETAALLRELNCPNLRLTVDLYHMVMEREPLSVLQQVGSLIAHVHLNRPVKPRAFPARGDGYDYVPFIRALRGIGYEGRVSIEAGYQDFQKDAGAALELMQKSFSVKPEG